MGSKNQADKTSKQKKKTAKSLHTKKKMAIAFAP